MPISRGTFLGCTIVNFNESIGWGPEPSQINITLVEDTLIGDVFIPVAPGSIQVFNFNGHTVRGIIQNWKYAQSLSGKLYTVTMQDPRALLEGVTLILSNYNLGVGAVKNLINVYGQVENAGGFGAAQVNENGIPWWVVKNGINATINAAAATA